MPRSKPGRIALGVALVIGGILGFLPILGFWMIPLGLYMLSRDFPRVRRFRRRTVVRLGRWWQRHGASLMPRWLSQSVSRSRQAVKPLGKVRHL